MRLGQLARRLEINAKEIVAYLESEHNVEITNHPNSKLPDEVLDAVLENFKPSPIEEMNQALAIEKIEEDQVPEVLIVTPTEEEVIEEVTPAMNEVEVALEKLETEPITNSTVEDNADIAETEEEIIPLNIVDGIIKAPKIDLDGIKVVGKIDLPEPKKIIEAKEEEEKENISFGAEKEQSNSEQEKKIKKEKKKPSKSKQNLIKRPSQQELEERRIAREEKKRLEQLEKQKAKKKAHYQKQIAEQKTVQPKLKSTKKHSTSIKKKAKEKEERPSSLWGKFMYWLNDK